ncbi:probable WRKY transcription factor 20 [Phtheirospermum japonicum]|uniref:Probable WRKY transcription factor 20 n=1 Tax=Phtheirospermum japonicum TaxID=374723 RepID=A0A830BXL1_9LAMI|nr:probable WRKY transcription factor 20 [Phtheirospermum japonicum]
MEDSHSSHSQQQSPSDHVTSAQDHVTDAAGSSNGARYRLMSPAKLPISRSTCISIPPGLSPTSFLESPVLLSNIKAEPSPTTGSFFTRQWMQGSGENAALSLAKNVSSGNTVEERMSSSFEFRFQTGASSTSGLSSAGLSIPVGLNRNGPVNHHDQRYSQPFAPSSLASQAVAVGLQDASICSTTDEINQGGRSSTGIQGSLSERKDSVSSVSSDRTSDDGYNWRKYGQKLVKGSEFPRSYYKCTYPNCEVKKIFERSPSGQITEIVYKGSHDHPKPQAARRNNPGALLSIQEEKSDKDLSITGQDDKLNTNNMEQSGSPMFSPLQTNEDGIDGSGQGINDDVEEDDPFLKRSRKMEDGIDVTPVVKPIREPRVVVQTVSEVDILDDGYRWRKYGQKVVRGNPNPRSYYKCTNAGCPVRKHVERASHDPKAVITTYEGKHNHDVPTAKNSSHEYAGTLKMRPQDGGSISLDLGVGIGRVAENRANEQMQALDAEAARNHNGMNDSRTMGVHGSQIPACYGIVNGGLNLYGNRENRVEDRSFQTPPIQHPSNQCQQNLGRILMGP